MHVLICIYNLNHHNHPNETLTSSISSIVSPALSTLIPTPSSLLPQHRYTILHKLITQTPTLLLSPLYLFCHFPNFTHPKFHSKTNNTKLKFTLLPDIPNPQPLTILLQHALIMIFPELFRRVLAGDALEDLGAAGVFVYES